MAATNAFFPGFQSSVTRPTVDKYILRLGSGFGNKSRIVTAQKSFRESEARQTFLESADKAKSDFLTHMSHEIRTPMGAIIGLVTVLMATEPDEKRKQCLATVQNSAEALMVIINRLLDTKKTEFEAAEPELAPFEIQELLGQIVGIMSVKAHEKGIGLTLHCDAKLSPSFIGDSGRIRQIVLNLVGNAIKFTEAGEVTITCANGRQRNGKKEISISVADSGIGIAKDKIDIIFKKFTQADSSIRRDYGGTGLGLSISKELAENMGGRIRVSSRKNKGSTFILVLPLAVDPSRQDAAFDECQTGVHGLRYRGVSKREPQIMGNCIQL